MDNYLYILRKNLQLALTLAIASLAPTLSPAAHAAGLVVDQPLVWNIYSNQAVSPPALSNLVAVACAFDFALGLRADGHVISWGSYSSTLLTNVPVSAANIVAIATGDICSIALRSDGRVLVWGGNIACQVAMPVGLSNVIAVATGDHHCLALRADGTVAAWGQDHYSETHVPPRLSNIVGIAAGSSSSTLLQADGTLLVLGKDNYPLTNRPTNVIAVSCFGSRTAILRADGTVASWGGGYPYSDSVEQQLGWSNAVAVSAAADHDLAMRSDGTLACWTKSQGPAGVPAYTYIPPGLSNVFAMGAGPLYNVALRGNGSPALTVQPANRTAFRGATLQLHARAAGLQPMSYQWQFNGVELPGATGASLTITNAQGKDSGIYRVRVVNALGSILSGNALLTVQVPQRFSLPQRLPNGSFLCSATYADGGTLCPEDLARFEAQASTNLINWTSLPNALVFTNDSFLLRDQANTNVPIRFYRLLEH